MQAEWLKNKIWGSALFNLLPVFCLSWTGDLVCLSHCTTSNPGGHQGDDKGADNFDIRQTDGGVRDPRVLWEAIGRGFPLIKDVQEKHVTEKVALAPSCCGDTNIFSSLQELRHIISWRHYKTLIVALALCWLLSLRSWACVVQSIAQMLTGIMLCWVQTMCRWLDCSEPQLINH